ncbi:hypothetical protein E2C01_073328 [Portunus trituberculatus]|uniref:Uncharacterized protein n=1 Tax=Portunus trituberculatus TaxID=210409 RepID=A0A5B7I2J3_PORTR|nr:hypothetical protein [Portunus trituberculatus]
MVDPPSIQLQTVGFQMLDTDPPIDETAPSIHDVKETVAKPRVGKADGICNINAELVKEWGEAMLLVAIMVLLILLFYLQLSLPFSLIIYLSDFISYVIQQNII